MKTAAKLILGIVLGILVSLMTLIAAQLGARMLIESAILTKAVAVAVVLSGALLGAVSVGLGYLTAGLERAVLVMLSGLAAAALIVIAGRYGSGSMAPLAIYSLALINGLLIARVSAVLCGQADASPEFNSYG